MVKLLLDVEVEDGMREGRKVGTETDSKETD